MSENPDYWNTIGTVIPVIALTYATALKRRDWHNLKAMSRRWIALYGAAVVGALAWAEWVSLRYLQQKSTSALDEALTLLVVGFVAVQVLAVPIAPLVVLAVHDLHPVVVRAKRSTKSVERKFRRVQRTHEAFVRDIDQRYLELRLEGTEQVLRDPTLVYDATGAVRDDYLDRVGLWRLAKEYRLEAGEILEPSRRKLASLGKDLKKSRKSLDRALRKITKHAVKITDMGSGT